MQLNEHTTISVTLFGKQITDVLPMASLAEEPTPMTTTGPTVSVAASNVLLTPVATITTVYVPESRLLKTCPSAP